MASQIDYWNSSTLKKFTSQEEYDRVQLAYEAEAGPYYLAPQTLSGFIHGRTGLVTADIRKFEKWLKKIEGK